MSRPNYIIGLTAAVSVALLVSGCERPPVETEQKGFRGVGMVDIQNPRLEAELAKQQGEIPKAPAPAPATGPKAGDIYQNVQVLNDLSVAQFGRFMQAMTDWVVPDDAPEGKKECNYCHLGGNLASDDVYTKRVSRWMIQMNQNINSEWKTHVASTGVTCYTCHRGQAVPNWVWSKNEEGQASESYMGDDGPYEWGVGEGSEQVRPAQAKGFTAYRDGQNIASKQIGTTSLPYDPFTPFLEEDVNNIRVQASTRLPEGTTDKNLKDTEWTYALMIHMSNSIGKSCNYCHNSRAWSDWSQSTPQRIQSWYGLRMVANLNNDYIKPTAPHLPDYRLGPMGDVPKVNCSTCHQGVNKPLNGANMLKDYPTLQGSTTGQKSVDAASDAADETAASDTVAVEEQPSS